MVEHLSLLPGPLSAAIVGSPFLNWLPRNLLTFTLKSGAYIEDRRMFGRHARLQFRGHVKKSIKQDLTSTRPLGHPAANMARGYFLQKYGVQTRRVTSPIGMIKIADATKMGCPRPKDADPRPPLQHRAQCNVDTGLKGERRPTKKPKAKRHRVDPHKGSARMSAACVCEGYRPQADGGAESAICKTEYCGPRARRCYGKYGATQDCAPPGSHAREGKGSGEPRSLTSGAGGSRSV